MNTPVRCSFCDKSQDADALLVASPIVTVPRIYICDECIAGCQSILESHEAEGGRAILSNRPHSQDTVSNKRP